MINSASGSTSALTLLTASSTSNSLRSLPPVILTNNPFEVVNYSGTTYVNVYSVDHQRAAGSKVRLRGPAQVTSVAAPRQSHGPAPYRT